MTDTASTETSVPEAVIEAAELITVIDADRRAGRSLCPDNDLRLAATIARYCLAESTITLSATDALALCRATAERDIAAAAPQNEALAPSDAERERVIEEFDARMRENRRLYGLPPKLIEAWETYKAATTPSPLPHVETGGERDIYEVANQLKGYVGPDTPNALAAFLQREGRAAAALADEIVRLRAPVEAAPAGVDRDSIRILHQFADTYRSGAQGAEMDYDAAQALALSIDDALSAIEAQP